MEQQEYFKPLTGNAKRLQQLSVLITVTVPLIATVYAIILLWERLVSWPDIIIMVIMYIIAGLGITAGYHRMLTHRSFEAPAYIRFIFLAMGSMAAEGGALSWATLHIQHHAQSDREGDPHSPMEGFFHAHVGWLFDSFSPKTSVYGTWLVKDRMVVFFEKTFLLWVVLGLVIPYLVAGWTGVLWGGLVRIFLTHHVTWSVNSVCHTFGFRSFETNDLSTNQWLVGLLAFGEGWHNNHHAFPRSAFHGMSWWQVDGAGYVIRLLERIGLATNVYRVSPDKMEARKKRDQAKQGQQVASDLEAA
ncbi:MAG TPA: acyl-CoA desaturase [Anaerolineae bacterium]|nr:acyl-CoA desaturase [Anaerolineae bacterium]MCB0222116.1 acyl-CoA desaturase [Anaerolineae bacterium]MCB9103612.1 acyl-CoA desaturase [Anaerolineales bacterium]HRV96470.1 acyl-CoA desaturase [Anaerolineae bacterium]